MPTIQRRARPLNVPASWTPHAAVPLASVSAVWLTRTPPDPLYASHGQIVVDWKDGRRSVYECCSRLNETKSEMVRGIRAGSKIRLWSREG